MTEQAEILIKGFEGFSKRTYEDSGGVLTIGFGETGKHVTPGMQISIQQAEKYLEARLATLEEEILTLVKVPLNDNQLSSLESFAYNLGIGALAGSTMLKLINKGDFTGAGEQFGYWTHVKGKIIPGLVNRRRAEQKLFLKPMES